jgi:hypothetical protein
MWLLEYRLRASVEWIWDMRNDRIAPPIPPFLPVSIKAKHTLIRTSLRARANPAEKLEAPGF